MHSHKIILRSLTRYQRVSTLEYRDKT